MSEAEGRKECINERRSQKHLPSLTISLYLPTRESCDLICPFRGWEGKALPPGRLQPGKFTRGIHFFNEMMMAMSSLGTFEKGSYFCKRRGESNPGDLGTWQRTDLAGIQEFRSGELY